MINATRGNEPSWFRAPGTITSATICRLSGKLATDGCRSVLTTDDKGNVEIKSQVYTEYFVRGTEPTDYCPIHSPLQSPAALASNDAPAAPSDNHPSDHTDATHHPVVTGGTVPATPAEPPPAPAPESPKKRGFWGKIFGR